MLIHLNTSIVELEPHLFIVVIVNGIWVIGSYVYQHIVQHRLAEYKRAYDRVVRLCPLEARIQTPMSKASIAEEGLRVFKQHHCCSAIPVHTGTGDSP